MHPPKKYYNSCCCEVYGIQKKALDESIDSVNQWRNLNLFSFHITDILSCTSLPNHICIKRNTRAFQDVARSYIIFTRVYY